ncbi:methionine ABC transporter permease [Alicyclobacillus macrosporangiidus]|jgi:D-methionine transport system permease protein|uniref:D-methionine transport system permease protein n=1 Tax=Alicyclobacillus macrosporangiidus TaxID=392015 RepID=A0A1I7LB38_9BACL|nr:methionine ABC transporter permease [Alicyclobacillus macrosporangiidus]SFV06919.1 D-methionine transport system permease protein [Alicyclobacillus macrosporangiidus]
MGIEWTDFVTALEQTLTMVGFSLCFSAIIGLPLGMALVVTRKGHILENALVFNVLSTIVNIIRSVPFIILVIAIIPFTRLIVGTSIGTSAAIVPMVLSAAPYISRLVENAVLEVDTGVIEAAQAMGATEWQIIVRFLLPEALPALVLGLTIATIGLVGESAMAGTVGGGGIGDLAITYGYEQYDYHVMFVTVVILILLVQFIQTLGNLISRRIRRR